MKATDLLKKQHRDVKGLFRRAKKAVEAGERRDIMDEISEKLEHHMEIEEEIFYPAVRELGTKKTDEMIPEAYEEHHVVKLVLNELPNVDPDDERFEAKMTVLDELIQHHVDEEEEEMFKAAQRLGDERLKELGAQMEAGVQVAGADADAEDEDDEDAEEADITIELEAGEEEDDLEDDEDDEEDEEEEATAVPAKAPKGGTRRSA